MPSIRSQLRAKGLLSEFLKEHHPDMFNRRYFQCFPANTPSLRVERFSEKLYNFMDVRTCVPDVTGALEVLLLDVLTRVDVLAAVDR